MEPKPTPGWRDDPLGIHQKRWWTGTQWTDKTTDAEIDSVQSSSSTQRTPEMKSPQIPNDKSCEFITPTTRKSADTSSVTPAAPQPAQEMTDPEPHSVQNNQASFREVEKIYDPYSSQSAVSEPKNQQPPPKESYYEKEQREAEILAGKTEPISCMGKFFRIVIALLLFFGLLITLSFCSLYNEYSLDANLIRNPDGSYTQKPTTKTSNAKSNQTPEHARSEQSNTFTNPITGVRFTIPEGWENKTPSHSASGYQCVLEPTKQPSNIYSTWISYRPVNIDLFAEAWGYNSNLLSNENPSLASSYQNELNSLLTEIVEGAELDKINQVKIKDSKLRTRTRNIQGKVYSEITLQGQLGNEDTLFTFLAVVNNGLLHLFVLDTAAPSDETITSLSNDLIKLVESVEYDYNQDTSSLSSSSEQIKNKSSGEDVYRDENSGVDFPIPKNWKEEALSKKRQFVQWKAYPTDTYFVGITYGVANLDNSLGLTDDDIAYLLSEDITTDDIQGLLSLLIDGGTDELIEEVTLSGTQYWKVTGSGEVTGPDGTKIPANIAIYFRILGKKMYMYQYISRVDFASTHDTTSYFNDFEWLVANAKYA